MKYSTAEIQYMSLFETITKTVVRDCVVDGNTVVFVVKEGEINHAIGRNGKNVKQLEGILNKRVEVVEYSPDERQFLKNIFYPANVISVNIVDKNGKVVFVSIDPYDKRRLSHKLRNRLRVARLLAKRHIKAKNVVVA